jgi:hypothetical protein
MTTPKLILLIINLLGGAAVIGSYILGFSGKGGGADAFWGGTPASVRPIYTVSMVISALGYFAFIYFILFRLDSSLIKPSFYIIFLGILGISALWMPLTGNFISHPSAGLWIAIRMVLVFVGLFSCALTAKLIGLHTGGLAYWLALFGSAYFAFHTTILDAILWPIFFKMH